MKVTKIMLVPVAAIAFATMASAQSNAQMPQAPSPVMQPQQPMQVAPVMQPQQPMQAAPAMAQAPRRVQRAVIAVEKFDGTDGSNADNYGQLRDRVLHRLVGTRKFTVVERTDLKKVLTEINLANAGLTDGSTAPAQGKLQAAGYVVYGKVLFCGATSAHASMVGLDVSRKTYKCELQLKFTDAETGNILASKKVVGTAAQSSRNVSEVNVQSTSSSDALLKDAIDEAAALAVDEIRAQTFPAKIIFVDYNNNSATANINSEEVRIGDIFDVFANGVEMRDPDTGEVLGNSGAYLGRMKVEIPGPKTSVFMPIPNANGQVINMQFVRPGAIVQRVSKEKLRLEKNDKDNRDNGGFRDRF